VRSVRDVLDALGVAGLVVECAAEDREGGFVPGRPLEDITVSSLLRAVRGERRSGGGPGEPAQLARQEAAVEGVLDALERAASAVGDRRSLADLLDEAAGEAPSTAAGLEDA